MKTKKNRKLQGSVLLTVVFVMSILIVFLAGTLALSMAANNRAHVNYSSAQTGVTARTVAEAAIKAIDDDTAAGKAYADAIGAIKAGDPAKVVPVSIGNNITGENFATMGNLDSQGNIANVRVTHAGKKSYYDERKKDWQERDILKFTADVTLGGVTSESSVYVIKHFKTDSGGNGAGGAGFVTTAGASFACQTSLYGGAYITLPDMNFAQLIDYEDPSTYKYAEGIPETSMTQEGKIKPMKLDSNGSPVVTQVDNHDSCETAFYLNNGGAVLEADVYVNNNMYVNNWSGFIFPDKKKGITIWGDLAFNPNSGDHLTYTYKGPRTGLNFNDIPYVYVDGKIRGEQINFGKVAPGEQPFPLNVYCGSIDINARFGHTQTFMNANLYCMDSGATNTLRFLDKTDLYAWSGSVVNKGVQSTPTQSIKGDVCVNGNLILKDAHIYGDLRVKGDLTCEGSIEVDGDVVVGGNIDGYENLDCTGTVYNATQGGEYVTINNPYMGQYYEYHPHEANVNGEIVWVDINNAPIHDWYNMIDGKPQAGTNVNIGGNSVTLTDGFDCSQLSIYYPIKRPEADGTVYDCVESNIDTAAPALNVYKDGIPGEIIEGSDPPTFYYGANVTSYTNDTTYTLAPDYSVKTQEDSFKYYPNGAVGVNPYLQKKGEPSVYPKYAEKMVLLGKREAYTGANVEGTKVINTMYEVLNDIANPHDYKYDSTAPTTWAATTLGTKYQSLMSHAYPNGGHYLTTPDEINTEMSSGSTPKYCTGIINSTDSNNVFYEIQTSSNAASRNTDIVYITKDCALDMNWGSSTSNVIVIDPESANTLVVIKNLSLSNGAFILVNDADPNKIVHIYVENNGKLYFVSQVDNMPKIATVSYMNIVKKNKVLYNAVDETTGAVTPTWADCSTIKFNCTDPIAGFDLADLGEKTVPNVNVYGGPGSKFEVQNMTWMSCNILSPSLAFDVSAESGQNFPAIYYNNSQVNKYNNQNGELVECKQFLFGCLNSKEVFIPNVMGELFVGGDGNRGGQHGNRNKEFWYKVLNYSEF